jgi:hypothetical protein
MMNQQLPVFGNQNQEGFGLPAPDFPNNDNLQFYNQPTGLLPNNVNPNANFVPGEIGALRGNGANPIGEEDELPLWQEIGIEPELIINKCLAVTFPFRQMSAELREDTDLAGPLMFTMFLGFSLLLQGKNYFGHIFGYGMFGSFLLWIILNLMSDEHGTSFERVVSVLGYSMVPLLALGLLGIVFSLRGVVGTFLSVVAIFLCTINATRYIEKALNMRDQRYLIAYPLGLLFAAFTMMAVF